MNEAEGPSGRGDWLPRGIPGRSRPLFLAILLLVAASFAAVSPAEAFKAAELAPKDLSANDLKTVTAAYKAIADGKWAQAKSLEAKAEARLSAEGSDAQVFEWFDGRKAETALGKARLAEALLSRGRDKDRPEAHKLLREAWIDGDFSADDEKRFLGRHSRLLSQADHIARMDRLLWEGRYYSVKRHLWRLPKPYQALGLARISLRRDVGNVDRLVSLVPKDLQRDPGLIYERLRWRRKKGRDSALDLARLLDGNLPYPELWWEERSTLVRRALRKGFVTDAYRIARNHGLKDGADFAEAEWLAGWVALRFLNEPKVAVQHFERLYAKVLYPISRARAAYWIGRSHEALGDKKQAQEWHVKAAEHPATYYGQLSLSRVAPAAALRLPPDPEPSPDLARQFRDHDLNRAFRILVAAGAEPQQQAMIRALLDHADENPGWRRLTADLATEAGRMDLGVTVAKLSDRQGHLLPSNGYPEIALPSLPKSWSLPNVEKPLVLGMIRQESLFRQVAISRASAQGLMQLMPATAKNVAKAHGLPFSKERLLTDGTYNLTLGQSYLAGLLNEFDGSYILSIAAYNAGPHRVRSWIRENGDPRHKEVDAVDWVELIPFDETRNYVQRVMENLHVYRSRILGTEVAFNPQADLTR